MLFFHFQAAYDGSLMQSNAAGVKVHKMGRLDAQARVKPIAHRVKAQFPRFHHAVAVDVVDGEFFGVVELERGNQVFARAGGKPFG